MRIETELLRRSLSQAKAAKAIGISPTALSQWINGKYNGDVVAVTGKIEAWLDQLEQADKAAGAFAHRNIFVQTETTRDIVNRLRLAQATPDMTIIAGVPGVSKTQSARHYAATNPHVYLVTVDPMTRTHMNLLRDVCDTVGSQVTNTARLRHGLEEKLAGTPSLLIFDECQHCDKMSLDMIRSLHDRLQVGIALLGNHGFFARTNAGSKTSDFGQFFSRIGSRKMIHGPTPADVDFLLDEWKIEEPKCRRFLAGIAGKSYALRGMAKTVQMAGVLANGGKVDLPVLKAAWSQVDEVAE